MSIGAYTLLILLAQNDASVNAAAWDRFQKQLGIETACLFWTAAEIAILFAVTVLGRVLRSTPLSARLVLTRTERRAALALALFVVAIAAVTYSRHLVSLPLPLAIEEAMETDPNTVSTAVHDLVIDRTLTHYGFWGAFLFAWVVLEGAIVMQGIRAYYALDRITGGKRARPAPIIATALLCGIGVSLLAFNASAQLTNAIEFQARVGFRQGIDDLRVVNRFAEVYVRVVSIAWIAFEWLAALYLVKGALMLRRFFNGRPHVA